jgi:hypothetical protein
MAREGESMGKLKKNDEKWLVVGRRRKKCKELERGKGKKK